MEEKIKRMIKIEENNNNITDLLTNNLIIIDNYATSRMICIRHENELICFVLRFSLNDRNNVYLQFLDLNEIEHKKIIIIDIPNDRFIMKVKNDITGKWDISEKTKNSFPMVVNRLYSFYLNDRNLGNFCF